MTVLRLLKMLVTSARLLEKFDYVIMQQGVHAIDVNKSVCKRPYPDKQPARKARALMYNEILSVEVQ